MMEDLTLEEAAAELGITVHSVKRACSELLIRGSDGRGRNRMIPRASIEQRKAQVEKTLAERKMFRIVTEPKEVR